MAVTSQLVSQLGNFFANPMGLAALAALIPLLIFYFIKPEPEEQVMPSMMFFMQQRESGRVSQALNRLVSNLVLLLQILFIAGTAAAIAGPLLSGFDRPDSTVLILDRSASMQGELSDAKSFLRSSLGDENTLILVGKDAELTANRESPARLRSELNSVKARDVETDIATALQQAREFEGKIKVASDLDQTVNGRNVETMLNSLDAEREVEVYEPESSNQLGFIDVEPGGENVTVEVKNFQETNTSVTVQGSETTKTATIEGGGVAEYTFPVNPGRNTFELPGDPVEADDTAYVSAPRDASFQVTLLADQNNKFLEKTVELISFTEYTYRRPPYDGSLDADIYFVGESSRILQSNIREVENQVKNQGKSMVIMQQPTDRFDAPPATLGSERNATVEIREPVRTSFQTKIRELSNINGTSMADPRGALLKREYGEGEIMLYNLRDEDFRYDFVYPIFWKKVFEDFTERPALEDLNRETGDTVEGSTVETPTGQRLSGELEMVSAGYYNTPEGVYAANLESVEESSEKNLDYNTTKQKVSGGSKANVQHLAALLLLLLVLGELGYLQWTGEI